MTIPCPRGSFGAEWARAARGAPASQDLGEHQRAPLGSVWRLDLPEQVVEAGAIHRREVVDRELLVARGHASVLLETADRPLHAVSLAVQHAVELRSNCGRRLTRRVWSLRRGSIGRMPRLHAAACVGR